MNALAIVLFLAVMLSFQDNSSNENGFIVEKTVSGNCTDGFSVFAYLPANTTSITDSLGAPGNCYRVAAYDEYGVSEYSNTAQVPVTQPPWAVSEYSNTAQVPVTQPPCKTKGKQCR